MKSFFRKSYSSTRMYVLSIFKNYGLANKLSLRSICFVADHFRHCLVLNRNHYMGLLALVFLFSSVGMARADIELRDASAKDISKAEKYLRDMKTAQARFVQTTHNGLQMVGTFYLDRPGKVRFDYDPPSKSFVVSDGMFIYFYDGDLEQQTNAPVRSTLANFFLRDDFSFSEDLSVENSKWANDLLQIRVVQMGEPDGGSITFAFEKEPFMLKKWRVVDGQGMITEVELFYLTIGITHKDDLFVYKDPNRGKKAHYNN